MWYSEFSFLPLLKMGYGALYKPLRNSPLHHDYDSSVAETLWRALHTLGFICLVPWFCLFPTFLIQSSSTLAYSSPAQILQLVGLSSLKATFVGKRSKEDTECPLFWCMFSLSPPQHSAVDPFLSKNLTQWTWRLPVHIPWVLTWILSLFTIHVWTLGPLPTWQLRTHVFPDLLLFTIWSSLKFSKKSYPHRIGSNSITITQDCSQQGIWHLYPTSKFKNAK